jgi:formylglycine-generating enzyme required for sulfatase activity
MYKRRLAFLFGIEKYDEYHKLPCVRVDIEGNKDHIGLQEVLSKHMGVYSFDVRSHVGNFNTAELKRLISQAIDITKAANNDTEETLLLFYFSGHGACIEDEPKEDQFLIAASDTELEKPERGLRFSYLLKQLDELKSSVICVVDCCYGGNAIASVNHYVRNKQNIAIFTSCSPNEESYIGEDQSRFTQLLIEVLLGNEPLALSKRELTAQSLRDFITNSFPEGCQTPTCLLGQDPIFLSRPRAQIPVITRLSPESVDEMFRTYVESRLREYEDIPDLASHEFYVRSECQKFTFDTSQVKRPDKSAIGDTLESIEQWENNEQRPLLLVMGDTGTGKTMALTRFWCERARVWLAGRTTQVPFLLNLRQFAGVRLIEGLPDEEMPGHSSDYRVVVQNRFRAIFNDVLQNREGLAIFWHDFRALCREGKILLLLDGLDEMDVEGLSKSPSRNFELLMQLFSANAKMLLSCRTHYLRNEAELTDILARSIARPVEIQQLILMPFDDDRVTAYLRPRVKAEFVDRWYKMRQNDSHKLLDLCERPFLLAYLVPNFEEVIDRDRLHPSRLFYKYLQAWLFRDDWRFQRFLTDFRDSIERDRARISPLSDPRPNRSDLERWDHRVLVGFIEMVATHFWATNSHNITAAYIPTIIRAQMPSAPEIFVSFFDYAIRTCSFFTRTRDNIYSFLHPSVLEYFAVRKFRDDILNSEYPWDCSRERLSAPVPRIPVELGRRPLDERTADMLADALRLDRGRAVQRLVEIIQSTAERVEASSETLFYLAGNCLSVYVRLTDRTIDPGQINLKGKWLNGALLRGVNLSQVNLSGAVMHYADLRDAILEDAELDGAEIYKCQMQGIHLDRVRINGNKKSVVVSDDLNLHASSAPPAFAEVVRLSNPKRANGRSIRQPKVTSTEMVHLPGGIFMFGTEAPHAQPYERPPVPLRVRPFYIDKYPVTNLQFAAFVKANPEWRKDAVIDRFGIPYYLCYWKGDTPPEGKESHPVVYVNWYAASEYAAWVGKRLPTEAEWEFALRDSQHDECWDYPYGATVDLGIPRRMREHLDYIAQLPAEQRTLDVQDGVEEWRISKNYRLVDMNGNVNEWVQDWFNEDYDDRKKNLESVRRSGMPCLDDYSGPEAGVRKVIRGGSYLFEPDIYWKSFTTYYRRPLPPANTNQDCGFRCARSASGGGHA